MGQRTITGLTTGTQYIVRVRAKKDGKVSFYSAPLVIDAIASPTPGTPSSPTVTNGIKSLNASWPSATGDISFYNVYCRDSSGFTPGAASLIKQVKGNSCILTSFYNGSTILDMVPGTTYYVKLKAVNGENIQSLASGQGSGVPNLSGPITASSIDIPDASSAGFHVDSSGNLGIGSTTSTTGNFKVSSSGVMTAKGITLVGDTFLTYVFSAKDPSLNTTSLLDNAGAFASVSQFAVRQGNADGAIISAIGVTGSVGYLLLGTTSTNPDVMLYRSASKTMNLTDNSGGALNGVSMNWGSDFSSPNTLDGADYIQLKSKASAPSSPSSGSGRWYTKDVNSRSRPHFIGNDGEIFWLHQGGKLSITSTQTVNASVTETDIIRYTITSNSMAQNQVYKITAWGDHDNPSDASPSNTTLTMKIGGVNLVTPTMVVPTSSAQSNKGWYFEGTVTLRTSAGASATCYGTSVMLNEVGSTTGNCIKVGSSGSTTVDTTVARDLALTMTLGEATAGYICRAYNAIIELMVAN